jgi:hypothetical protein
MLRIATKRLRHSRVFSTTVDLTVAALQLPGPKRAATKAVPYLGARTFPFPSPSRDVRILAQKTGAQAVRFALPMSLTSAWRDPLVMVAALIPSRGLCTRMAQRARLVAMPLLAKFVAQCRSVDSKLARLFG